MPIQSLRNESATGSPEHNRLTIAHLLLWMTMTGMMLAWQQSHSPPKIEDVDYAGSISASNEKEWETRYAQEQLRSWRRMNAQHWLGIIASPFTGIVMSATLWSCFELLTRRFRFPTQPGHWILLAMAVILAITWVRAWLLPLVDRWLAEFISTALVSLIIAGIAVKNWSYVRWTLTFASLSIGWAAMAAAAVIVFAFDLPFTSILMVGWLLVACFPVFAFLCCLVDLFGQGRFDIFHWIGIGTLGGFSACFWGWLAFVRSIE